MTHAQKWLAEGRAEGKAEGKVEMLQEMLEKFFGPLSADARQRIDEASPKQLESWALAVPTAVQGGQSVDDVLNGAAG